MRVVNGHFYVPDNESDIVMLSSGINYQGSKLRAALKYVKQSRLAIDIGAHCGLWTKQLGDYFDRVECFEPMPIHAEAWRRNIKKQTSVLHECALGDKDVDCGLTVNEQFPARSYVDIGGIGIPMVRLDNFNYQDVDLIKVDCEGFELFVLKGGEETIKRCRPTIIVEQKPGFGSRFGIEDTSAVKYLESLGATVKDEITGDYILTFEDK